LIGGRSPLEKISFFHFRIRFRASCPSGTVEQILPFRGRASSTTGKGFPFFSDFLKSPPFSTAFFFLDDFIVVRGELKRPRISVPLCAAGLPKFSSFFLAHESLFFFPSPPLVGFFQGNVLILILVRGGQDRSMGLLLLPESFEKISQTDSDPPPFPSDQAL